LNRKIFKTPGRDTFYFSYIGHTFATPVAIIYSHQRKGYALVPKGIKSDTAPSPYTPSRHAQQQNAQEYKTWLK